MPLFLRLYLHHFFRVKHCQVIRHDLQLIELLLSVSPILFVSVKVLHPHLDPLVIISSTLQQAALFHLVISFLASLGNHFLIDGVFVVLFQFAVKVVGSHLFFTRLLHQFDFISDGLLHLRGKYHIFQFCHPDPFSCLHKVLPHHLVALFHAPSLLYYQCSLFLFLVKDIVDVPRIQLLNELELALQCLDSFLLLVALLDEVALFVFEGGSFADSFEFSVFGRGGWAAELQVSTAVVLLVSGSRWTVGHSILERKYLFKFK